MNMHMKTVMNWRTPLTRLRIKVIFLVIVVIILFSISASHYSLSRDVLDRWKSQTTSAAHYDIQPDPLSQRILRWGGAPVAKGCPHWQRLDNQLAAFVYAAHFDDVEFPPLIRVVGLALSALPFQNVTCHLYGGSHDDRPGIPSVSGRLCLHPDKDMYTYKAAYVECPLWDDDGSRLPHAVSVSREGDTGITNYLVVHYGSDVTSTCRRRGDDRPADAKSKGKESVSSSRDNEKQGDTLPLKTPQPKQQQQQRSFTWTWNVTRCFPPIFGSLNDYQSLAETVAASMAMGVDHFVFYVKDAGPNMLRMLQVLEQQGLAEVYPWNLDISDGVGRMHYQGQYPACQDCLARHLSISRFIIFGDLDELFVPRKHRSLMPALAQVFEERPKCGAFLFSHVMFPLKLKGRLLPRSVDPSRFSQSVRLTALTHVVRHADPWTIRTKPVVDPRKVFTLGVHAVRTYRAGFEECSLDPQLAVMHHYRQTAKSPKLSNDSYLYNYAKDIIHRMKILLHHFDQTVSRPYP